MAESDEAVPAAIEEELTPALAALKRDYAAQRAGESRLASLTPEELDAEIAAEMGRDTPDRARRLEVLLKARWGGGDADDAGHAAAGPLPVPPVPWGLGHAYDDAALAELGPAVTAAGVPLDELTQWIKAGHGMLEAGSRTRALVDEVTVSAAQLRAARSVVARFTPSTRVAVERWLETTGLHENAGFILWLSQYGSGRR